MSMYATFAEPSTIMLILPPKGPAAFASPALFMSMRIFGSEKYALPVIFTLPLAEVVAISAEKGGGPWKAKAEVKTSSIRDRTAGRTERLCFTGFYLLEKDSELSKQNPEEYAMENPRRRVAFQALSTHSKS